ncbi:hypothetical protein Tco_0463672, partial [Tanacetum coccineum]
RRMKETTRGTETAIIWQQRGMEVTEGVVIDREVTDRVISVTDGVLVLRGRGITRINRFWANIIVVLMGHQARVDTRIMPHLNM